MKRKPPPSVSGAPPAAMPPEGRPPRWADRLLEWFCAEHRLEEVQGDLHERFHRRARLEGEQAARRQFVWEVLGYFWPRPGMPFAFFQNTHTDYNPNYSDMLSNYFKIALRNLLRHKSFSFINIAGLSVGMAVAILIGLWVYDEWSFNKYHRNYDRIAQVLQNQTFDGEVRTWWSQAMQLAPELRASYGNQFKYVVTTSWAGEHILSIGDKVLSKSGNYMEPEAPSLLTLRMLKGTRGGLQDPRSILLSQSVAQAFFGEVDPMNKVLKIDNKLDVKVTGVYEDLPANSNFANLAFIAPFDLLVKSEGLEKKVGWGNSWFQTLVQIADNADMGQVSAVIEKAKLKKISEEEGARFKPVLFLHPMSRWHLYSDFKNGVSVGGGIEFVWLFGVIGLFVLLLACINFMNLSTARSEKRAKEVGIRKAVGSVRGQLVMQFLGESLLVAAFSLVLSLLIVWLTLPWFNEIADKKMTILWANPSFWLLIVGFSLLTGALAGSYPAFYLSSFNPVKALKGTFRVGRLATIPRKVLVVVQFAVSITLIIGTIGVFKQIQYAKNRPIGYNREGVIAVPMKTEEVRQQYNAFRNDLLQTGAITAIAQSESPVTNAWVTNSGFVWRGKDAAMQDELVTMGITHDFGKIVSWQIEEGRDFSTAFPTDSAGFVLNEAAVKYMGFKQPIGETVKAFGRNYQVIGVVKDMVMQSLYAPVRPTIFYIDTFNRVGFLTMKISPQMNVREALGKIEKTFKKHHPATPFEYTFADEDFAAKYRFEERIGKLAFIFSVLTVFISCLGLFGLASFTAEQRTKEIGIRKVLGASVTNLWTLLSKDFVVLVICSCLLAIPIAWYFLSNWLRNYEYRTEISWWIFAMAGMAAMVITLLTVSYQAIKTALANPVKSLRTE